MKEESVSKSSPELVQVVIMDRESCRLGLLDEDVAMTLIAVASEDHKTHSRCIQSGFKLPRPTPNATFFYLAEFDLKREER